MERDHYRWTLPILGFLACGLVFLSLSRALLVVWQLDRVAAVDGVWYVLLQGVRFDLVLLAQLIIIPVLLVPLLSLNRLTYAVTMPVLRIYFLIVAALLIFVECITPNFIGQYDFRPNVLMIEYLAYPKEVISMLLKAVPLQLFLAISVTATLTWYFGRLLKYFESQSRPAIFWSAPLLTVLGLILCVSAARSTVGHRPVNPSTVAFSSDTLVNSLPLSSGYSVAYALYEKLRHEQNGMPEYGELAKSEVLSEVFNSMNLSPSEFLDPNIPTLHSQRINKPATRKNLVIILEESLGADFVGSLGGRDITPNLDRLSNQGIWFENLYATGTRSVRGIEAVITGFLPTPARSVVKLGGSQNNFFTIAQLLADQNYQTSFIYGGEAHFDNMKRFFSNNGFNQIIEQKDFVNPEFVGSWGVSDEDLLNQAHATFEAMSGDEQPFFSLVFTSTNHSPFEFPDGRIDLAEQPKNTVANAVKYADYALGEFIEKAKQSDYWKDTVFLIIADHSDRVYGNELVPISKFRIPGLIMGADIDPVAVQRVTSQVDMLPTLLSLIGVESKHPAIGIDLTRQDINEIPGRAIMQFAGTQAYMENDKVVVLQKQQKPQQFTYANKTLYPVPADPVLQKRALAHSLWPVYTYKDKAYRLP
ncbi:LTA synthase family protein [Aliiglaciecola sp. LCG003]|uniref:LTA synthase family protein n=1 Tax=Aliiglaciecola sp. LCG003 TaxID=3053655 RepID=UPI002574006E|nr:LTA synthase family protein [Aliiglaciecola sp. LCG003]WJG09904.1 LTA synthase family protein [Aliiglaciecola sp. LCG003]